MRVNYRLVASLFLTLAVLAAQETQPAPKLNLVVVAGNDIINNVKQRTARETIVQVEDENHKPVAGAAVIFLLPGDGPGGAFAGGVKTFTATTDAAGRATARFVPNQVAGKFDIHITATAPGRQASITISQTNAAGPVTPGHHFLNAKTVGIIGGIAAASTVGICRAAHCGGWGSTTDNTIALGTIQIH